MAKIYIISENGNGEAFRLLGDPSGTFQLFDGKTKHEQGHGVPRNWVVASRTHPKVAAVAEQLDAADVETAGQLAGDEGGLKTKLNGGGEPGESSQATGDTSEVASQATGGQPDQSDVDSNTSD